jgi:hypothetical protein
MTSVLFARALGSKRGGEAIWARWDASWLWGSERNSCFMVARGVSGDKSRCRRRSYGDPEQLGHRSFEMCRRFVEINDDLGRVWSTWRLRSRLALAVQCFKAGGVAGRHVHEVVAAMREIWLPGARGMSTKRRRDLRMRSARFAVRLSGAVCGICGEICGAIAGQDLGKMCQDGAVTMCKLVGSYGGSFGGGIADSLRSSARTFHHPISHFCTEHVHCRWRARKNR